jgi:hypothetical protein
MSDELWDWVYDLTWKLEENGLEDLADKIDNFTSSAYGKDAASVEAAFPELLAYARSSENAWLETFLRHWRLQAYVNTPKDPRPLIPEALELLAFSHSEEAIQCPQRICVTDDINDLYAAIDAKGFASERIQMVDEALEGLPVNRGCYVCMTFSKIEALFDLGQGKEGLASLEDAMTKSERLKESMGNDDYYLTSLAPILVRGFVLSGKPKEALELANKCTPKDAYNQCKVDLLKVQAHIACQQLPEAKTSFEKAMKTKDEDMDISRLVEVIPALANHSLISDLAPLITRLVTISKGAQSRGRAREAFDSAYLGFKIATQEGMKNEANSAIQIMSAVIGSLNRPEDAQAALDAARNSMS